MCTPRVGRAGLAGVPRPGVRSDWRVNVFPSQWRTSGRLPLPESNRVSYLPPCPAALRRFASHRCGAHGGRRGGAEDRGDQMADGACATNARTPREASLERAPRGGGGARKACYPGFLPDRPPHPPNRPTPASAGPVSPRTRPRAARQGARRRGACERARPGPPRVRSETRDHLNRPPGATVYAIDFLNECV